MSVRMMAIAAAMTLFASPAFAAIETDEAPACMAPLEISTALVEEAAAYDYTAFYAGDAAVLVGALSPTRENADIANGAAGSVLFVRTADGAWRAFLPREGETLIAAYQSEANGALVLFTHWQSGGPGPSWTMIRLPGLSADASAAQCHQIDFPAALNQPQWANEFLSLADFDINAHGRGELIGSAQVEREGAEQTWWFAYATRDGGATWDAPRKLRRERAAREGIYEPREILPASVGLVAELHSAAEPPPAE